MHTCVAAEIIHFLHSLLAVLIFLEPPESKKIFVK